jgi:WhiB family transcriptional regulator, redox-sensing transcriptional regulator
MTTPYRPLVEFSREITRPDLEWLDGALCAQTDPEIFFPEMGVTSRDAKRVCMACEVRAQCLEYALDRGITHGVFGGLSERQRRPLLAARRNPERAA